MRNNLKLSVVTLLVILFFHTLPAFALNIFVDKSGLYHDAVIPSWLESLGHTVVAVTNYSGQDLSQYDVVMDFGYDQWTGLNATKKAAYSSYLKHGGGLYLQGEKPVSNGLPQTMHIIQDQNIISFVDSMGGGTITALWTDDLGMNLYEQAAISPVTTNTNLSYKLDFGLAVIEPGNGFFVVETFTRRVGYSLPEVYETGHWSSLIGFDFKSLSSAPGSRLIVNFDVTGVDFTDPLYVGNQDIMKEIVTYLGTRPPQKTLTVSTSGTGGGTVNSNPSGIACESRSGVGCSAPFADGTPVTLTALPDWKSDFVGWTVGCNGSGISCDFFVDGDTNVQAIFNYKPLVLLPGPVYYATILDGYTASGGGSIRLRDQTFNETLAFDRTIDVTLDGGFDAAWNRGGITSIHGALAVIKGTVAFNSIVIE